MRSYFFNDTDLDQTRIADIVGNSLNSADDGELYLEHRYSEFFLFDDGRLKETTFDTSRGFGLRGVSGEFIGYAHSSDVSETAIKGAGQTINTSLKSGHAGSMALLSRTAAEPLYMQDNPLESQSFESKIKLLQDIDAYARSKSDNVVQVTAGLTGEWRIVEILRADGHLMQDIRPLVGLSVSLVLRDGDRMELGRFGIGGRHKYDRFFAEKSWKNQVDEAFRQASINLHAVAAPAGEVPVILGPGWPGVMLHEAIGHGLEGDFNRKKTSAFSDLLGKQVASKGITVVDDGTMQDRRGSISMDDEGTPSQKTTLIEDGVLVGYMQDRQNARLMNMRPTGNGRRQSYAHMPMPRMTNTYMLNGQHTQEEMIREMKNGILAVDFGGGQVDITSGSFVFEANEAYKVENGKITSPLKGATLIGHGPEALKQITMIGNDLALDPGIGTCGKDGQSVPVGVGQPSMLISKMTVGGTDT
jgi:TldD protein